MLYQVRQKPKSRFMAAMLGLEVIFHSIVRDVRSMHSNAFMALGINLFQAVMFVGVFFLMFMIMGMRAAPLRGDFLLYIMSGIFLYMTHIRAVGAVAGAGGSASPMHQHAPMNTLVGIISTAVGALYMQLLVALLIVFGYHVVGKPVEIYNPLGVIGMLILAWYAGCGVGFIFLAIKPWAPGVVKILTTFYQRANMIASGKMFVANALPGFMLAMFDWNPLFHAIDQSRGFMFINYVPRYSSWEYTFWVGTVLIVIGMIGMFYGERSKSISWSAKG
ncbi:MAG: ABC transporter permease [Rhodobacteraceae bacterium]|nr:ABC transporter permease [Paracoccaceae bacterium]